MQELLATEERREKLRKIANTPNINGDTRKISTRLLRVQELIIRGACSANDGLRC